VGVNRNYYGSDDHVVESHLPDALSEPSGASWNGDELHFDTFASALGEVGYDGCISVECFKWMREDKAQVAQRMMSTKLLALGLRR